MFNKNKIYNKIEVFASRGLVDIVAAVGGALAAISVGMELYRFVVMPRPEGEDAQIQLFLEHVSRDHTISVVLLAAFIAYLLLKIRGKRRSDKYRLVTPNIHMYHHYLRDCHTIIHRALNDEISKEDARTSFNHNMCLALGEVANIFGAITNSRVSACVKRIVAKYDGDVSGNFVGTSENVTDLVGNHPNKNAGVLYSEYDGNKDDARVLAINTWYRDNISKDDRAQIDLIIKTHSLDRLSENEHFLAVIKPNTKWELKFNTQSEMKEYGGKMSSSSAWDILGRDRPYKSILFCAIATNVKAECKNLPPSEALQDVISSTGVLYIDSDKNYAFGYYTEQLLHSLADAMYSVMMLQRKVEEKYLAVNTTK